MDYFIIVSMKNLVKNYIEEIDFISPEKFLDRSYLGEKEWDIYQEDDNTLLYIFYDLIDNGIGYAYCVKIKCGKMKYDIDTFQHSKNFSNVFSGGWEECEQETKDRLLCDAIQRLKIYER